MGKLLDMRSSEIRLRKLKLRLKQGFSNCGTRTTCGRWKVVRWYAIKLIKILNLKSDETILLTKGEVQGAKK